MADWAVSVEDYVAWSKVYITKYLFSTHQASNSYGVWLQS